MQWRGAHKLTKKEWCRNRWQRTEAFEGDAGGEYGLKLNSISSRGFTKKKVQHVIWMRFTEMHNNSGVAACNKNA
jgi:hypothetical protein